MLHTKRLVIVLGFSIVAGCLTQSSYTPIDIKYDTNILFASLDGFRIQMSPRMAKRIANEKGYRIDSGNLVTFDDIVEGGVGLAAIYLTRSGEELLEEIRLELGFEYGKIYHIKLGHVFFANHRQRAEELLDSYFKKYPQLVLSKEEGNFRIYTYKPNQFAHLSVTINTHKYSNVNIYVYDMNYVVNRENLEIHRRAYR